jgi:hypothetical protein
MNQNSEGDTAHPLCHDLEDFVEVDAEAKALYCCMIVFVYVSLPFCRHLEESYVCSRHCTSPSRLFAGKATHRGNLVYHRQPCTDAPPQPAPFRLLAHILLQHHMFR